MGNVPQPQLLPLALGGRSRAFAPAAGGGTPVAQSRVFERDRYACRYCGFVSKKFQELHRIDGEEETREPLVDPDIHVTACFLCHQVHHLDRVGEQKSGVLIWLPEMGQAALHHVCRAIYVANGVVTPLREAAELAFAALKSRSDDAKARLGTDDPKILAEAFEELNEEQYGRRGGALAGIRLLPFRMKMENGRDAWGQVATQWRMAEGAFGDCLPHTWGAMLEEVYQTISGGRG